MSVPQGITVVRELLPQPEKSVPLDFSRQDVLGEVMQLANAPCRWELLWRCRGRGGWAPPALLSQALPRAGASLVRGGFCVLYRVQVSEQAFTRLSFPGEEEKEGDKGRMRTFAERVTGSWPPESQVKSSEPCFLLSSVLVSQPFGTMVTRNSKINWRINCSSEFNTTLYFLSGSCCKVRVKKLMQSPQGPGQGASHLR